MSFYVMLGEGGLLLLLLSPSFCLFMYALLRLGFGLRKNMFCSYVKILILSTGFTKYRFFGWRVTGRPLST